MAYASTLFDDESILSVNIIMEESQWEEMLDNAVSEVWYPCDITINGTTYQNVGIRPKGNTSLTQVASDDTTDRFSFKIKFDHYVDGQTCDGLDSLVLNNLISDATYMKEYFSYDMFNFMGVTSSLYSFADLSLNGETWGLYLALENPSTSFLERNYGTGYGQLYKPETDEIGGGMGGGNMGGGDMAQNFKEMKEKKPDSNTPENDDTGSTGTQSDLASGDRFSPNGDFKNGGGGRGGFGSDSSSNLGYISDDVSDYSYIFDNAILSPTASDEARVINALKNIGDGTDLETYLDVDQMLRYMAVNVFLVNLDSYFGTMLHNYLLYESNGQITMLPWDYNLAFAGFQSNGASDSVNLAIDSVVSGASLEDRPLLYALMQVEEYKEQYHKYLDQLVSQYFESGYFEVKLAKMDALITSYVANDPTAFYTHEEYQTAVNTLKTFCSLRSESVRGQLDGTIPSTEEEQAQNPDTLVATDGLNISDMGTQGGGGDMDGGRENQKEMFSQKDAISQNAPDNGTTGSDTPDNSTSSDSPPSSTASDTDDLDGTSSASPEQTSRPAGNFSPGNSSEDSQSTQVAPSEDSQGTQAPPSEDASKSQTENTPPDMPAGENSHKAPGDENTPGGQNMPGSQRNVLPQLLLYGGCLLIAILGLLFAKFYRRRK
jgi:spore coat protein CotH